MSSAASFDRYTDLGTGSLAPLFRGLGSVVYVLEFADGEYYVGQTVNMTARFTSHRRLWNDIVALQLRHVAMAELRKVELDTIKAYRASGAVLRNRAHNYGHNQPTALDLVVPVVDQKHWALGGGTYDTTSFAQAAQREPGTVPRMVRSKLGQEPGLGYPTLADAIVADLSAVLACVVPDAVSTEQTYWTISDYPATARGRMVTLITGVAETLFVPRGLHPGVFDDGTEFWTQLTMVNVTPGSEVPDDLPDIVRIDRSIPYFKSTKVDMIAVPTGSLALVLEYEVVRLAMRELVLHLMRSGTPSKWARWHSMELARQAYAAAIDVSVTD